VLPPRVKRRILHHRRDVLDAIISYRMRTGQLGPLPSFLIIGFGKCGTTYLYERLQDHPNVYPSLRKEVNYFIFRYDESVDWYRAHFAPARSYVGSGIVATGEASPGYVLNPGAPRRIAELLPDVKLIALVRDPVERAYSQYHHQRRLGVEPLPTFEAALDAEPERIRGQKERLERNPDYTGDFAWYTLSYLMQGIYADYLEPWLDLYPRDQLLVIPSGKLYKDSTATLQEIAGFIGLPPWQPQTQQGHRSFAYPPMELETRARLKAFYAPHNERLFNMLGVDYGWNDK
jgi:hypothetical protein